MRGGAEVAWWGAAARGLLSGAAVEVEWRGMEATAPPAGKSVRSVRSYPGPMQ